MDIQLKVLVGSKIKKQLNLKCKEFNLEQLQSILKREQLQA